MRWLFLFQVFLVVMIWFLARYFYRHSVWLLLDKPTTISINRFQKIISLIIKNDIFLYVVIVPITLATILGGVSLLMLLGIGALNKFESFLYSQTWWGQVLIWVCFILCYFAVRVWWDEKRKKSFLRAKKDDSSTLVVR
jgi:hypothetical protein